jgi:serine/threonine-protein kinase
MTSAPAIIELEEGTLVADQYEVERVVGKVGTCMLVKVRSVRHGGRLVLKHLTPKACAEPFAVEQFLNAARVAMRLRSEHTAHTVDAGTLETGLPYLVTESFQGAELRDILRVRGSLPRAEAIAVVLQAAHALAEAQRQGLAHGSLSPSALFLTRGPEGQTLAKVLDFGSSATLRVNPFAVRLRHWTQGTAVFSESIRLWDTLACTAPERLRDFADATHAGDVWSLGAVLYELLLGKAPFSATSAPALVAAVVADEPRFEGALARRLPRELKRVILRCLSKSPTARFQSAHELAVALRRFAPKESRPLVDRIARIQAHDPEQAPWFTASRGRERRSLATPAGRRRLTASLLLLAIGVVAGAFAGKSATRSLTAPARTSAHAGVHVGQSASLK